jgi:riboflavin kinase/FMN adenylyltransferase
VRVAVGERLYDGVANFGRRPMFDSGVVLLEVFLFDFAGDLYGKPIDVAFIAWIREEKFFGSIDELVQAINEDSRLARDALTRAPNVFPPIRDV